MWPGDPVSQAYWSEENTDGLGSRNTPSDRRFVASVGPFRLDPEASEEIVVAMVWARGADRLDSITKLRDAGQLIHTAWDDGTLDEIQPLSIDTPPGLLSPANGAESQPLRLDLLWDGVDYAMRYEVDVANSPDFSGLDLITFETRKTELAIGPLDSDTDYYWRVRPTAALSGALTSEIGHFQTGNLDWGDVGIQFIPGTETPAFLEIVGPGGIDPCAPAAESRDGCAEAGGNAVYLSLNSTGEYYLHHSPSSAEVEPDVAPLAPNDFEIRFTSTGSYAGNLAHDWLVHVPFELWDVGPVGLNNENDPSDDVRLIPFILSEDCEMGFTGDDDPHGYGFETLDRIYGFYPTGSYAEWEAFAGPLVDASENGCYKSEEELPDWVDFGRPPLGRILISTDPEGGGLPGEGTIIRFYTTPSLDNGPFPAAPGDGSGPHPQPLTLVWNGPDVSYQIQLSEEPSFTQPAVDHLVSGRTHLLSGLEEGTTYDWRVRMSEPVSPWSEVWAFTAGTVTNVAIEPAGELPSALALDQNYPNPFNPSTTIRFGLPEAGPVRLTVYDLLGRRIATLVDENVSAGWHAVRWDASRHASGVYVYTIEWNGRRDVKSLVVVR